MRISIDWFKEFVKTNDSTEDIANTLTMLGLEAESPVDITQLEDIIIGEVVECKKHPNADRLKQCKVSDGKLEIPIICGAPNVCLLYTSPSPRDRQKSRMPSSA